MGVAYFALDQTWYDVSEVPSNEEIYKRVNQHPAEHPRYGQFTVLIVSRNFVDIAPLDPLTNLFPARDVGRSDSECCRRKQRLKIHSLA